MKKIHKTISLLLGGMIVGMGFFSCGSQKAVLKQISEKEKVVAEKEAELQKAMEARADLIKQHENLQQVIRRLTEQTPLVYAPPVPNR